MELNLANTLLYKRVRSVIIEFSNAYFILVAVLSFMLTLLKGIACCIAYYLLIFVIFSVHRNHINALLSLAFRTSINNILWV